MIPLKQAISSSVGRKFITALTGLGAVVFVIAHLSGNLLLFHKDGTAFNQYTETLEQLGILKEIAEWGLVALFGLHVLNSLWLKKTNVSARGSQGYRTLRTKGGPTKSTVSSRNMAISGTLLLIYLLFHIKHFTLGPGMAEGYVTQLSTPLGAKDVRDLHRLVVEEFSKPLYVGIYVSAMTFLGLHLRHGVWSALQSLGLTRPRTSPVLYVAGSILGILIAAGFLALPVYIYLFKNVG